MIAEDGDAVGARILLAEDDDDYAAYLTHALRELGGHSVTRVADGDQAMELIAAAHWDILVADIHLPGPGGLDLVRYLSEADPSTRSVVIAAAGSGGGSAAAALRARADEFLAKPVPPDDLLSAVNRLSVPAGARGRRPLKVLAVGAHPDDVEIGVGGVLLAHRAAGDETAVLTLTHGAGDGERDERADAARHAADLLGAQLYLRDLTDTAISDGDPTVRLIEEVVAAVQPTTVYTHSRFDTHRDHRNTSAASMVACRAVPNLYCYPSPSSATDFRPTRFVGIDAQIDGKLAVIEAYASQPVTRDYVEPELARATARYWGRHGPGRYAESLEVVRERAPVGDGGPTEGGGVARPDRAGSRVEPRPAQRPPTDVVAVDAEAGGGDQRRASR